MESYSAKHAETVEELLEWPWRRFERFYESFVRREVVESLERRKEQMIAALWSNSNYDDDKNTRQKAIEEIEGNFEEVISQILNREESAPEEDIDEANPFFQKAKEGQEKLLSQLNFDEEATTVKEAIDYHKEIDQD